MAFSLRDENVCGVEVVAQAVERCPFLRNIAEPTAFSYSSFSTPSFNAPSSVSKTALLLKVDSNGYAFLSVFSKVYIR